MSLEINPIGNDTEIGRLLNSVYKSKFDTEGNFVEIGKDKFVLSSQTDLSAYKNFQVDDDNVFVCCHPKTGSSWLQEAVWLINNDLDFDKLNRLTPFERFSFFDMKGMPLSEDITKVITDENVLKGLSDFMHNHSTNNFKTHLHWSLLPEQIQNGTKKPKIFVTLRNPYDTCISYYHFSRLATGYIGNFEQFCELFMAGKLFWGPYWKSVLSYWEQRHRPNIMFVQYREMTENFPAVMKKVASFLGKTLSDEQIDKLTEFLNFDNMRANPALNRDNEFEAFHKPMGLIVERTPFIRVGKEGTYKTIMSAEMLKKFEAWVEENIAGTGLSF